MLRCSACGVRVPDSRPTCPRHGSVEVISSQPVPGDVIDDEHSSAREQAPPRIAPELAGFEHLQEIGRGGFGTVYRAKYKGHNVALKVAVDLPLARAQLARECEILRRLPGRKTPRWVASETDESRPCFLAMELINAPTLANVLEGSSGPLDTTRAEKWMLDLIDAVNEVHRAGFVHRDLKPENFFVTERGLKVFDFGLARPIGSHQEESDDERWAGTPEYMAPEQCEGESLILPGSDIYSIGVILYEMLAGHPPFWGTEAEIKEAHRSRRPPLLSKTANVGTETSQVVHRCLAKSIEKRFENLDQLRRALTQAVGNHPDTSSTTDRSISDPSGPERTGNLIHDSSTNPQKSPAVAPRPARDRQTVGLVWFESNAALGTLNTLLAELAGQLASTAQNRHIAAFSHDAGDNPVRAALHAARTLMARTLATRAIVDIATVSLRTRPDGSRQYMSPSFSKRERFPNADDPPGIYVTDTAAELIPETPIGPAPRVGMAEVLGFGEAGQVTIVRRSNAPFFGHGSLVDTLVRSAAQAANGRPTLISVVGAAGYGKSALASHLAHAIADCAASLDVEALRALEPIGLGVHRTLDELTRRVLSLPDRCPPEQAYQLCCERLGLDFAQEVRLGLSVALGWLSPDAPELRSLSAAPGALRSAAAFAVGKVLRRLSSKHALAIILDDAHYVDETLLDALEYAALAEGAAPLWVCLLARPSFREQRPNFGERATKKLQVELPALTGLDARAFARHLLHPVHAVPERALALLVERTQGVPLLLAELVRGLRRDGIVRPSERGSGWILATDELERLPALPAVQWLAANEVAALPPQLAALARLAAVQGPHFTSDELDTLVGELEALGIVLETDLDVSVGLKRLTDAGVIASDRRFSFRFRHELLRGILYESVDEQVRSTVHRAAYVLTTRRDDLVREEKLQRLAFHAGKAGLRAEAAQAYLELAALLQSRHAYVEGEATYTQALQNLDEDDPRRLDALWRLGTMQFRVGRNDDALKQLDSALALARARNDTEREVGLLLDSATVLDWLDDYNRSSALVSAAQECAQGLDHPLLAARIALGLGRARLRLNNPDEACGLTLKAAQDAKALGDDGYETHVIALLLAGAALGMLGRIDESREVCDQAMVVAQAHGDNLHLGSALQNRVFVWIMQHNIEALYDDMRRVIEIARESGASMLEGRSLYNLGEITYLVGDYRAAERHARRSIEVHHSLVGPGNRTLVSQLLLARTQLATYDVKAAKSTIAELRATQAKARELGRADAELVTSDALLLDVVDAALRDDGPDAWTTLLTRAESESIQQEQIEVAELAGISARLRGDLTAAQHYFERALTLAQSIPNIMETRLAQRKNEFAQRLTG